MKALLKKAIPTYRAVSNGDWCRKCSAKQCKIKHSSIELNLIEHSGDSFVSVRYSGFWRVREILQNSKESKRCHVTKSLT